MTPDPLAIVSEPMNPPMNTLQERVTDLGIPQIRYHLFLCATPTKAKCCDPVVGLETWEYLKSRLRELKLDQVAADSTTEEGSCIYRTKADCLRVCQQGPILVVYPDRIWYHSVTPIVIERIIQEHLLQQQVVTDYLFYNPADEATPTPKE